MVIYYSSPEKLIHLGIWFISGQQIFTELSVVGNKIDIWTITTLCADWNDGVFLEVNIAKCQGKGLQGRLLRGGDSLATSLL